MTQMGEGKGDPQTYALIGAAMEVHRNLGCGFLEPVYQDALSIEFATGGIPFIPQMQLPVVYKGKTLAIGYRVDFLCFETILVELKSLARLSSLEEAQVINYLKASKLPVGLLFNFGASRLEYKRLVLSSP